MSCASKAATRQELEKEIETQPYRTLLDDLRKEEPLFERFTSWENVVMYMRSDACCAHEKDQMLCAILQRHHAGHDPRWRTVLLVLFWPALTGVHHKKRTWDHDSDERWQNILVTFLEVLCRLDPSQRSHKLVSKIYNDLVHRLGDAYRPEWTHTERMAPVDPTVLNQVPSPGVGIDITSFELTQAQNAAIVRLQRHLANGVIRPADFALLVNTRVYGTKLTVYARAAGLKYDTAKKRRYRAERAIRKAENMARENRNGGPAE